MSLPPFPRSHGDQKFGWVISVSQKKLVGVITTQMDSCAKKASSFGDLLPLMRSRSREDEPAAKRVRPTDASSQAHENAKEEALQEGVLTQISNAAAEDDPNSQMKLPDPYGVVDDDIEDVDDAKLSCALTLDPLYTYTAIYNVMDRKIIYVSPRRMMNRAWDEVLSRMPAKCKPDEGKRSSCAYDRWLDDFLAWTWPIMVQDSWVYVVDLKTATSMVTGKVQCMYILNACSCTP